MLHEGNNSLHGTRFSSNVAAAASLAGTSNAPGDTGSGSALQYMLGEVSSTSGGAVYVWRGALRLQGCELLQNIAWGAVGQGGGVYVDEGELLLQSSYLQHNWAGAAGGGVCLGPRGDSWLRVVNSTLLKNTAGQQGGAIAAGLVLGSAAGTPAALQAADRVMTGSSTGNSPAGRLSGSNTWQVDVTDSSLLMANVAGEQGGGLACQFCRKVVINESVLDLNIAAHAGGGVSCIGCGTVRLLNSSLTNNAAATGGGAFVIAAGPQSFAQDVLFDENYAGSGAAAASRSFLAKAGAHAEVVAVAGIVRGNSSSASLTGSAAAFKLGARSVADRQLPKPNQTLPACGVVGSGGGLCIGLSKAGFALQGSNRFVANAAAYGAGLYVQGCARTSVDCSLTIAPDAVNFDRDFIHDVAWGLPDQLQERMLEQGLLDEGFFLVGPAQGGKTGVSVERRSPTAAGAGPDMYVNSLKALGQAEPHPHQHTGAALTAASRDMAAQKGAQRAAPAAALPAANLRMATDPYQLGHLQLDAPSRGPAGDHSPLAAGPAPAGSASTDATGAAAAAAGDPQSHSTSQSIPAGPVRVNSSVDGKVASVLLPVQDQLSGLVTDDVSQQLTVQATPHFSDCAACRLTGVSKVVPVNGTARFKQLGVSESSR